jgi:hypothetical protein
MYIYHFSDSKITKFKHTKPKRNYSQASGYGIYFATDLEKGIAKYGNRSKYLYICEFIGNYARILNLGEYDSMYFNGQMAHSSDFVTENFKRMMAGMDKIPEPDIKIENLSKIAFEWLRKAGFQAVMGMDYWGYACQELCLIDENAVNILKVTDRR